MTEHKNKSVEDQFNEIVRDSWWQNFRHKCGTPPPAPKDVEKILELARRRSVQDH